MRKSPDGPLTIETSTLLDQAIEAISIFFPGKENYENINSSDRSRATELIEEAIKPFLEEQCLPHFYILQHLVLDLIKNSLSKVVQDGQAKLEINFKHLDNALTDLPKYWKNCLQLLSTLSKKHGNENNDCEKYSTSTLLDFNGVTFKASKQKKLPVSNKEGNTYYKPFN